MLWFAQNNWKKNRMVRPDSALLTAYLCSPKFCCLMRASILAVMSSHSLLKESFWGVVRPLSFCGVSEHENDLSRLLWARHTAAYCTMLSSAGGRRQAGWESYNSNAGSGRDYDNLPETRLWLSCREFISLLNLCWAEHRLHRYLAILDLSVTKLYFFLLPRLSITNLRFWRTKKRKESEH